MHIRASSGGVINAEQGMNLVCMERNPGIVIGSTGGID